jgi:ubiquinone/menaquinone biosynthesis C-methylase UbiE
MSGRAGSDDLIAGIEGLALLRGVIAGALPERSVHDGYADWSKTYDRPGNPLIHLEETVLLPLLAALPPGRALDAACGTGRVSGHLAAAGHEVVGIDTTPAMLERARAKVPSARFVEGRLEGLPVDDASFDLAVCALALDHFTEIGPAIGELARAVRPRGRVILTDIHPAMVHLGGQAAYVDEHGAWAFVRAHPHLHCDFLRAFAASGLDVEELIEPLPDQGWFEMQVPWTLAPDAFRRAFEGIPAAIVWSLVRR